MITERDVFKINISITRPQLCIEIILKNQIPINIIFLFNILWSDIKIIIFWIKILIVQMISTRKDKKILRIWWNDNLSNKIWIKMKGDFVTILKDMIYRWKYCLLRFEIFWVWKVDHICSMVVDFESDLMNNGLKLLPH